MAVYHDKIMVKSGDRVYFEDITAQVKEIYAKTGVKNGMVLVFTGHTTCSVQIQEFSDGKTRCGVELIMQDLVNVLSKIVPTCENEGQYLHPCPNHFELAKKDRNEEALWCLNTDGHLRSVIMGRSVTIPIIDGKVQLGDFGCIYFGDWDQTRNRTRTVLVTVMGE
jgi:secondary thiamine-phosphate synthase enzyme